MFLCMTGIYMLNYTFITILIHLFESLMKSTNKNVLVSLCNFIKIDFNCLQSV